MLKFFVGLLVVLNGLVFLVGRGYLGDMGTHEAPLFGAPLAADKLRVLSAQQALTPPPSPVATPAAVAPPVPSPTPPPVVAAVAKPQGGVECRLVGDFTATEASRFESTLSLLTLGSRLTRQAAPSEVRFMVYTPPLPDKTAAERKAVELKLMGVDNLFVIPDSDLRWAISLGIFKTRQAAEAELAQLTKRGVKTARIGKREQSSGKVLFKLQGLTAGEIAKLDKIVRKFPQHTSNPC